MYYRLVRKDNRMSDCSSKEALLEIIKREFGVDETSKLSHWEPNFDDENMVTSYIADNEDFSLMCYR